MNPTKPNTIRSIRIGNPVSGLFFMALFAIIFSCGSPQGAYYIDSLEGSDSNDGKSPRKAWRTLENASAASYEAGDQILLKGGQTFTGSLKLESLEGKPGRPIVISSYGNQRAVINSGDSVAVRVSNSSHVDVNNLVVKGSGRLNGNRASGLELVRITNLNVDNIDASGYIQAGITVRGGSDIRITNALAFENGFSGIHVTGIRAGSGGEPEDSRAKNVYIGHSIAHNNPGNPLALTNHSGNGILVGRVNNCIIEYCESYNNGWDMPRPGNGPVGIWAHDADNVIIQYCYAHNNKTSEKGADGGGFDFDGGMTNSIMQYNMSAFNEGSGYGIYQYRGAPVWDNNIVRYNISYHDGVKNGKCGIHVWVDTQAAHQMSNFHAYNNTVVNKFGYGVHFTPGHYENFVFENNIFMVTEPENEFVAGRYTGASFDRNLYFNTAHHKEGLTQKAFQLDPRGIYQDPLLVIPSDDAFISYDAGTINTVPFFMLQQGSPARAAGKLIPLSGGQDYWKNTILQQGSPNIGAHGK
jgi:hypothetical protein